MKNKSDLVDIVSRRIEFLKKEDIDQGISEILVYISSTLSKGKREEIRGFGSLSLRPRSSRIGRNPKTGTSIVINKKYHPYFRASKSLKRKLNS